jgi:outer membrane protein TolC
LPSGYRERNYDEAGAGSTGLPAAETLLDASPIADLDAATARDLALLRHPDPRAAAAAVEAAMAEARKVRAAFLPEVEMGIRRTHFDRTRSVSIPGGASFSLGGQDVTTGEASLTISLFAFGRDGERLRAAGARVATEILAERGARQRLLHEVDQAWLSLHETTLQIGVAEEALRAAERQHEDAANLFASGRVTQDAVFTAEVEARRRRHELQLASNAALHARRVMNTLLRREPEAETALAPAPGWSELRFDAALLRARAREHNPGALAFRTRARELAHLRESVERSFLPELTGSLAAEYTDFTEATGFSTNYSAAIALSWRPWSGGRDLAELDRIHAELARVREEEIAFLLELDLRIARTSDEVAEAEAEYRWTRDSVGAATENLRIVGDRFRAGRANAQEVLEAQSTLSSARFLMNRARFRQLRLVSLLEAEVGLPRETWLQEP